VLFSNRVKKGRASEMEQEYNLSMNTVSMALGFRKQNLKLDLSKNLC
jgi:hypothetical protein